MDELKNKQTWMNRLTREGCESKNSALQPRCFITLGFLCQSAGKTNMNKQPNIRTNKQTNKQTNNQTYKQTNK